MSRAEPDVIVLGGGAAGLMCAAVAGARGRRVLILEGSNRCGKKILMSGGGRCNFTNRDCTPENFLSANHHFCKSALARYTPADFVARVEAAGIAYHEKQRGQLFCDDSAKQIVGLLLADCAAAGVEIRSREPVAAVARRDDRFVVDTAVARYVAPAVVVATGGLSIPRMGASGIGYRLARDFGIGVREPRAALVPFTLSERDRRRFGVLAGVGLNVEAACNAGAFDAGLLFTHRGLSGPAMLQTSSYWRAGDVVMVDFLYGIDARDWLSQRRTARPDARLASVLAERMPRRLAQTLCGELDIARGGRMRLRQLDDAGMTQVAERLTSWPFKPEDTEGYRTAEVTLGGVDTNALSSTTLEAKAVPGLYFIGEVVDVTGHLGGHNFQWAWASAQAAGGVV